MPPRISKPDPSDEKQGADSAPRIIGGTLRGITVRRGGNCALQRLCDRVLIAPLLRQPCHDQIGRCLFFARRFDRQFCVKAFRDLIFTRVERR